MKKELDTHRPVKPFCESGFFRELMTDVYGRRQGGSRIIIDGENASTGSGKTSCGLSLMAYLSVVFDYEISEDDLTLSGNEYMRRVREHPGKEQPSVLFLDEVMGAGSGDSRRGMSKGNVRISRVWALMRKKRIVTFTTLPHWKDADARMRRFADYRLHCLQKPLGYCIPYKIGATFDKGSETTKRIGERFRFLDFAVEPDTSRGYLYRVLEDKKDELLASTEESADALLEKEDEPDDDMSPDEIAKERLKQIAYDRHVNEGVEQKQIAEIFGYSGATISRWINQMKEQEEDESPTKATA